MNDADTSELFQAYVKAQKQLWQRWMEIASRLEILSAPEYAWWLSPYKVLDEKSQETRNAADVQQAWLQLWQDSLNQDKGVIAGMIEWNRRIQEYLIEGNKQFLSTWSESIRDFGDEQWDQSAREALAELEEAVKQAMSVSVKLPLPEMTQADQAAESRRAKTQIKKIA